MSVDLTRLRAYYAATKGSPYRLGAKWPISNPPELVKGDPVDCSGWVRWALAQTSPWVLPDGSQCQWAYVRDTLGWREVPYHNLRYCENDPTRLFIAFKRAAAKNGRVLKHGHVLLVSNGQTIESFGGRGVGSREWDCATLRRIAAACCEVPVG